jgi:hypothetical protein
MATQPEKPCVEGQGGHSDLKGHCCDPKGLGPRASSGVVRDAEQPPPFRAPNDIFRYTTKKLFSIAAQYTTSKQAAEPLPALSSREMTPGNSKMMSSNITIQDAKKDARGGKNR